MGKSADGTMEMVSSIAPASKIARIGRLSVGIGHVGKMRMSAGLNLIIQTVDIRREFWDAT
jgi:hypothetical protein